MSVKESVSSGDGWSRQQVGGALKVRSADSHQGSGQGNGQFTAVSLKDMQDILSRQDDRSPGQLLLIAGPE